MSEKPHPEAVAVAMELFPVTPLEFDRDNGKSAIAEQEAAAELISAAMDKAVAREMETTRHDALDAHTAQAVRKATEGLREERNRYLGEVEVWMNSSKGWQEQSDSRQQEIKKCHAEFRIICSDLEKSELKVKALTAALQKTRKYMENFAPLEELRQVVEALEVKSAR